MLSLKRSRENEAENDGSLETGGNEALMKRLCVGRSSLPERPDPWPSAGLSCTHGPWSSRCQQQNVPPQSPETEIAMDTSASLHQPASSNPQFHPQQPRRCLRCLSGEPGHITHILG